MSTVHLSFVLSPCFAECRRRAHAVLLLAARVGVKFCFLDFLSSTFVATLLYPGERKRVPVYIPPPLPEDEDHMFETIQKGINFDKYDQINVECTGQDALNEQHTIRRFLSSSISLLTRYYMSFEIRTSCSVQLFELHLRKFVHCQLLCSTTVLSTHPPSTSTSTQAVSKYLSK